MVIICSINHTFSLSATSVPSINAQVGQKGADAPTFLTFSVAVL